MMPDRAPLPRAVRIAAPVIVALLMVAAWQAFVTAYALPPWLVPSPRAVLATLVADRALLASSLWVTLSLALAAFALAVVAGVAIALAFAQSRWIEASFPPYAILLR
jgi:NitT/TauT family transport system permease protein